MIILRVLVHLSSLLILIKTDNIGHPVEDDTTKVIIAIIYLVTSALSQFIYGHFKVNFKAHSTIAH